MFSTLHSLSSGPGLSHGQALRCVLGQDTSTRMVPLFTHVYQMVPANLILVVTLQWTSILSRGGVEKLLVTPCYRTRMSSGLMGHFARITKHSGRQLFLKTMCSTNCIAYTLFCYFIVNNKNTS